MKPKYLIEKKKASIVIIMNLYISLLPFVIGMRRDVGDILQGKISRIFGCVLKVPCKNYSFLFKMRTIFPSIVLNTLIPCLLICRTLTLEGGGLSSFLSE